MSQPTYVFAFGGCIKSIVTIKKRDTLMDQRDRAFLFDVANLISMNRVAAAHALRQAWDNAEGDT
jgi:hypothetical protein